MADKQTWKAQIGMTEWKAIHERIAKGWTLYPPPPFDESFYRDVPATELKWPTPLGWMTLAEYNRRTGARRGVAPPKSA